MTHSYRKVPILGIGGSSEKHDKQIWHRAARRKENVKLATSDFMACTDKVGYFKDYYNLVDGLYKYNPHLVWRKFHVILRNEVFDCDSYFFQEEIGDEYITTHTLEVSNPWSMAKDGKYFNGLADIRRIKDKPRHTKRVLKLKDKWTRVVWCK